MLCHLNQAVIIADSVTFHTEIFYTGFNNAVNIILNLLVIWHNG